MERKPQQQTLSIRINDTLRGFLERSRDIMSLGRGEALSISDVAKFLLECWSRPGMLDWIHASRWLNFSRSPRNLLLAVRIKLDRQQPLSRVARI